MTSGIVMRALVVVYTILSGICLFEKNYPAALYWFAASLITTSVLWGMK